MGYQQGVRSCVGSDWGGGEGMWGMVASRNVCFIDTRRCDIRWLVR